MEAPRTSNGPEGDPHAMVSVEATATAIWARISLISSPSRLGRSGQRDFDTRTATLRRVGPNDKVHGIDAATASADPLGRTAAQHGPSKQVVREPRIQGDSIAMTSEDCQTSLVTGVRILCETTTLAVAALGDVRGIEIRQSDTGKTILLIVLLAPVALAVTVVMVTGFSCGHYVCG